MRRILQTELNVTGRPARTRIAPTPSGYVHLGNAVNFLIVARCAAQVDARIQLRIDDLDPGRQRPEFIEEIFWALDWLDIPVDDGPRDAQEYRGRYAQSARHDYYWRELLAAQDRGLPTYYCTCSRSQLAAAGLLGQPNWSAHACRQQRVLSGAVRPAQEHTVRVMMPADADLADPVVWRRDDLPGYHLASIVDDRDADVTLVVRGADLVESTHTQRVIAHWFDAGRLVAATFLHHELATGADGSKLAKSDRAQSLRSIIDSGVTRSDIEAKVDEIWTQSPDLNEWLRRQSVLDPTRPPRR